MLSNVRTVLADAMDMPVVLMMRIRKTAKIWIGTLYVPFLPVVPQAGFVLESSSCLRRSSAWRTSSARSFRPVHR